MSLTTDDIEDIKQLLAANNSVLMVEIEKMLDEKLEIKFEEKLAPIKQQISDLTDFVTDAIDTANEVHGKQLGDHEVRITKFEQKAA